MSHTENGKTCQKWTSQKPHVHGKTPSNYPGKGLGDHNYCRNPDGDIKPWCFTTGSLRFEHCKVGRPSTTCNVEGMLSHHFILFRWFQTSREYYSNFFISCLTCDYICASEWVISASLVDPVCMFLFFLPPGRSTGE